MRFATTIAVFLTACAVDLPEAKPDAHVIPMPSDSDVTDTAETLPNIDAAESDASPDATSDEGDVGAIPDAEVAPDMSPDVPRNPIVPGVTRPCERGEWCTVVSVDFTDPAGIGETNENDPDSPTGRRIAVENRTLPPNGIAANLAESWTFSGSLRSDDGRPEANRNGLDFDMTGASVVFRDPSCGHGAGDPFPCIGASRMRMETEIVLPPIARGEANALPPGEYAIAWLNAGRPDTNRDAIALRIVVEETGNGTTVGVSCKTESADGSDFRLDVPATGRILERGFVNISCRIEDSLARRGGIDLIMKVGNSASVLDLPDDFSPDIGNGNGHLEIGSNRRTTNRRTPNPFRWTIRNIDVARVERVGR